ncbi:MAG: hypothetical protein KAS72_12415 [Phycisphaerales bacterium]|nr:hypothetical protein [Phycisphaerales bacterium]
MATTKQIVTSFKSAVNHGTPAYWAVQSVAKRWKTTPARVTNVLTKEKYCTAKSFNGHQVYWQNWAGKQNTKWAKESEYWFIQHAINWALTNGWATPEDFKGKTPRQIYAWLMPKFNKYFSTYKKTTTTKTRKPKTKVRKATKSPSLKYKGRTVKPKTRKYRKAA